MPLNAFGVASPPNLRAILALANTGWTTGNVENVLQKLQKIGIRDASGLASSLRHEDGRELNAELRRAGEKGFAKATLEALQAQVREFFPSKPAAAASTSLPAGGAAEAKAGRSAAPARRGGEDDHETALQDWLVVHTSVYKRAAPSLDADVKGILRQGRTVRGAPVAVEGVEWLRVREKESSGEDLIVYILISGERLGFGTLLQRAQPSGPEAEAEPLAPEPPAPAPAVAAAGAEATALGIAAAAGDFPWLLGVRSGCAVFLAAHTGLRLDVQGTAEGAPELAEGWARQLADIPLPVGEELASMASPGPPGERNMLRARFPERGSWQKLTLERLDGNGPVCSGDRVFLRAHTGRLLMASGGGDEVGAEAADAGDFPGWSLECADGQTGELWHGSPVRLRAPGGELLCVEGDRVRLRAEGEEGPTEWCTLRIEKDLRSSDLPDWEAPAPSGWWRVTHRPSIYVHVWPDHTSLMPAAYCTDTVLAAEEHCLSKNGDLWLRLRGKCGGADQWARTTARDCGFDGDIMELLPTQCGPPSEGVRLRHYSAVEAMHRAREQGRRAANRGDRPASLTYALCTEEMVADVYAAEHAATVDRSAGHPTATYSCPAALALVGDLDASGSFARRLLRDGFAICDNALTRREASELAAEAERLDRAGLLHEPEQPTPGQRGDRIAWLSETGTKYFGSSSFSPAINSAILLLKGVADGLNPALSRHHAVRRAAGDPAHMAPPAHPATDEAVLTVAPRAMLATYPGGGARYIAHQDNMYRRALGRRGNPRELTAIVYATAKDWDAKQDGGELKLYLRSEQFLESPEGKGHREVAYVAPTGGRLVVFFSALWHEVLPAYRERRAVTLWIYRPSAE